MEEEKTKVCFKCGRNLPLEEFYKHPRMADGHLNKCKDCTRKDVRRDYDRKSKDESWMEAERIRSREKYGRLGYKDADFNNKTRKELKPDQNTRRSLRKKGIEIPSDREAHHWNYNRPKSVIILSRKAHRRIHNFITVNRDDKFCYTLDGDILDTEEKTLNYYRKVLSRYDDLNEKLEITDF